MKLEIDHILLGIQHLEKGIEEFKLRTGIQATFGGIHPSVGTQNALSSLGAGCYVEIIAPVDPSKTIQGPFGGFQNLKTLSVFGWSIRTDNMNELSARLDELGVEHSGIIPGSRIREDGVQLHWKTLFSVGPSGVNPFFIEWENMDHHPSLHRKGGLKLKNLEFALAPDHAFAFLNELDACSGLSSQDIPPGQLLNVTFENDSTEFRFS